MNSKEEGGWHIISPNDEHWQFQGEQLQQNSKKLKNIKLMTLIKNSERNLPVTKKGRLLHISNTIRLLKANREGTNRKLLIKMYLVRAEIWRPSIMQLSSGAVLQKRKIGKELLAKKLVANKSAANLVSYALTDALLQDYLQYIYRKTCLFVRKSNPCVSTMIGVGLASFLWVRFQPQLNVKCWFATFGHFTVQKKDINGQSLDTYSHFYPQHCIDWSRVEQFQTTGEA